MPHDGAFHLGIHCLPNYLSMGIQNEKGQRSLGKKKRGSTVNVLKFRTKISLSVLK